MATMKKEEDLLEVEIGDDIYLIDSSSEDEDLLSPLHCGNGSDSDYVKLEIDNDYDESTSSTVPTGPSTSAPHGSVPTLHHPPPLQMHSDDKFEPALSNSSAPLTVAPTIQVNLATRSRTSQRKRRHASTPLSPPPSSKSDSNSPVRIRLCKRKTKHGRGGSPSSASVKVEVKVEEEEERWHTKDKDTRQKHGRDESTSTAEVEVEVEEEEEEERCHNKDKDTRQKHGRDGSPSTASVKVEEEQEEERWHNKDKEETRQKHGRDGSTSAASVKVEEEQEEERWHNKDKEDTRQKHGRDGSTSTASVEVEVEVEEEEERWHNKDEKDSRPKHGQDGSSSEEEEEQEQEEEEERWHNKDEKDRRPQPFKFFPARTPGPVVDFTVSWSPLSLFRLFFSTSVVRTIIKNTNAYAKKRKQAGLKLKWTPLTDSEFWIFMSIILFTGLVSVHQRSDYWRKEWPYGFSFPRNRMTRERFEAVLFSLHLSNPKEDEENERKKNTPEYDRLLKLKPLYTEIVSACQAHFQPYQNLCIDERMVATKARISFKQYMKDKPTKWGYKIFVLADAETAYTINFFVYQGKSQSTTARNLSFSSVWDLLPFHTLGSGYTLYVDNYYTSPALFKELLKRKIGCCGTIRTNQIDYPKTEVNDLPKNAERGDMRWLRRGKLLFLKWKDTREVSMCSTVHEAFTGQTITRRVKKAGEWKIKTVPVPSAVMDYNQFMGGVDLSDALIKYYSVHRKTMKWYKTFFYHFIDVAVVNSFLLHKELCKKKIGKPYTQKIFREKLAKEMLDFAVDSAPPQPAPPQPASCMPMLYGPEDIEGDDKRRYCQRCHNAGQKRVKTRVYCRKCQVALCFVKDKNCFVEWHDARR